LVVVARCEDRAWSKVVYRYALTTELACQAQSPVELRSLGPGIDKHRGVWPLLLHTSDGYDSAPTAFGHRGQQGLQQLHRGAQVDGDLLVEAFAGDGAEVLRQFDGGVQHQDIDRRPSGDGGGQMVTGVVTGKILAERSGLPAYGLDLPNDGGGITGFLGRARVMDGQARACTGKTQGDRATDFAAGAGHQGGAAGHAERGKGVGHGGTPRTRLDNQHSEAGDGKH
jgi:hypothetical protein